MTSPTRRLVASLTPSRSGVHSGDERMVRLGVAARVLGRELIMSPGSSTDSSSGDARLPKDQKDFALVLHASRRLPA